MDATGLGQRRLQPRRDHPATNRCPPVWARFLNPPRRLGAGGRPTRRECSTGSRSRAGSGVSSRRLARKAE